MSENEIVLTKQDLFLVCIIIFLVAGILIGFMLGSYDMQNKWENFFEDYKEEINKSCICVPKYEQETSINLSG